MRPCTALLYQPATTSRLSLYFSADSTHRDQSVHQTANRRHSLGMRTLLAVHQGLHSYPKAISCVRITTTYDRLERMGSTIPEAVKSVGTRLARSEERRVGKECRSWWEHDG